MLKSNIYIICKKQANIVVLSGICDMLSGICYRRYAVRNMLSVLCCQEYAIGAMLSVIYYWVKLYFTDICNLPTVP